jgi:hypothetical protein
MGVCDQVFQGQIGEVVEEVVGEVLLEDLKGSGCLHC